MKRLSHTKVNSKHGFCGFNDLFCNSECQNKDKSQCEPVPYVAQSQTPNFSLTLHSRPSSGESGDAMASEVRIGYYGAWSAERSCDQMQPENIPAGVLTHINVAFEYVSADHEITDEVGHITGRVSRLKNIYPGLRVSIALGLSCR
jgi:GH18 family chitinase